VNLRNSLIILTLLLNGCVGSKMIQTYGDGTSKYAPSNDRKGGIVSYSLDARKSVIKKSRETAYKRMYDFCAGSYQIEREGQKSGGGMAMNTPGNPGFSTMMYSSEWVIHFTCN